MTATASAMSALTNARMAILEGDMKMSKTIRRAKVARPKHASHGKHLREQGMHLMVRLELAAVAAAQRARAKS